MRRVSKRIQEGKGRFVRFHQTRPLPVLQKRSLSRPALAARSRICPPIRLRYIRAMRDYILQEIRRLADVNGQAPGQRLFASETSIAEHQWRGRFWSRWGDALVDAGFQPNKWNGRSETTDVLSGIVTACRHYGRLPTYSEMEVLRRTDLSVPNPNVIKRHFGARAAMVAALAQHAGNKGLSDIAAMLPIQTKEPAQPQVSTKAIDGYVYLIKSGDHFKIGRSDDAERRFKQISVALPDKAELFHTIRTDDPSGIESYWHRRFADRRTNGEWFKLTVQDVAAFRKRKFQ